jgi:hypothetical protein
MPGLCGITATRLGGTFRLSGMITCPSANSVPGSFEKDKVGQEQKKKT